LALSLFAIDAIFPPAGIVGPARPSGNCPTIRLTSARFIHFSPVSIPIAAGDSSRVVHMWRLTMQRNRILVRSARFLVPLVLALVPGCTSVKMTGSARTGTEQLLLTGTWDNALSHVDFSSLAGTKVFLDTQFVTVVDKDYIISSIRRTMAEQGLLLESSKDKAQNVVEVAFGAYGTDERDRKFGLPGLSVAPSLTTGATVTSSGSSTSLTFSETNQQDAVVKASLFAYEAKSGRLVWESLPLYNAQGVRDHFVMGAGPYRLSSRPEVAQYPSESANQTRKQFIRDVIVR
jgi:hypothetical protein